MNVNDNPNNNINAFYVEVIHKLYLIFYHFGPIIDDETENCWDVALLALHVRGTWIDTLPLQNLLSHDMLSSDISRVLWCKYCGNVAGFVVQVLWECSSYGRSPKETIWYLLLIFYFCSIFPYL